MDVMRHWWLVIDPEGNARGVRGTREEADEFIRLRDLGDGYTVVEYAPADAGAVGVLRELAQMPLTATGKDFDRLVKAARALLPEYADIAPTGGQ